MFSSQRLAPLLRRSLQRPPLRRSLATSLVQKEKFAWRSSKSFRRIAVFGTAGALSISFLLGSYFHHMRAIRRLQEDQEEQEAEPQSLGEDIQVRLWTPCSLLTLWSQLALRGLVRGGHAALTTCTIVLSYKWFALMHYGPYWGLIGCECGSCFCRRSLLRCVQN